MKWAQSLDVLVQFLFEDSFWLRGFCFGSEYKKSLTSAAGVLKTKVNIDSKVFSESSMLELDFVNLFFFC